MGERDAASREAADARARLSELALELGRRTNSDYVREQARELMTEKRTELKTRAKARVKETAVRTTSEMRRSPRGVGTFGALLGAGVGAALARRFMLKEDGRYRGLPPDYGYRSARDIEERYGYGPVRYESDVRLSRGTASGAWDARSDVYMDRGEPYAYGGGYGREYGREEWRGEERGGFREEERGGIREKAEGIKSKAADVAHQVKEKASDVTHTMRERTGGAVERAREHAPTREDMRARAEHARMYARETVDNRPMVVALGALAFGFIASQLLPVSDRERRMLSPAKEKARVKAQEAMETARTMAEEKIGAVESVLGVKKEERREGERIGEPGPTGAPSGGYTAQGPGMGGPTAGPEAPSVIPKPTEPGYSAAPGTQAPSGEGRIGPLPPLDDVTKRGY